MTTFQKLIATGADDGRYQPGGGTSFSNSQASINQLGYSGALAGFFRFTNITIPQASTINTASIRWVAAISRADTVCRLTIHGELATNPSAVTSNADAIGRTRTTASVNWDEPSHTANSAYTTADFASVIQEIVNQGGWSSGNAMQFFVTDNGSDVNAFRQPYAYDGSTTLCARLDIDYTAPATGNPRYYYAQQVAAFQ